MIKAVFFDAIDTLFQAYPDKITMYQRIVFEVTGLKVPYETMREAWEVVLTETEAAAVIEKAESSAEELAWVGFNGNLLRQLGYTGDCATMGEKLKQESWGNPNNYRLFPDVLQTLKALKEKGITIGCISNEDGFLNKFFEQMGIEPYFEFILASEEVGVEKPSPQIFLEGLKKTKLSASEVIFVGDSLTSDYFGASSVGMKPLLIDRGRKISDDLIVTINNLNDVLEYIND